MKARHGENSKNREGGGMTGQDWDFHEEGGGLVIDGYHGVETDLAIPAAIDGRPVTVIGEKALSKKNLSRVTIPFGITAIRAHAFSCNRLTEVTLPGSIASIGFDAFFLNELTSVTIQEGPAAAEIGTQAFVDNAITRIVLPDNVTSISWSAFAVDQNVRDNRVKEVTIGADVAICEGAIGNGFAKFYNRHGRQAGTYVLDRFWYRKHGGALWDYDEEEGKAIITGYHGAGTEIAIPACIDGLPVDKIRGPGEHWGIFVYAKQGVTAAAIPEGVRFIEDYAFIYSTLTAVTLPSSLTWIGENSFWYNHLNSIIIPPKVNSIVDGAFHNNTITLVGIGADVDIGEDAIDNGFVDFYTQHGRAAGIYRLICGRFTRRRKWRYQPSGET
jgi:hypothetical protein